MTFERRHFNRLAELLREDDGSAEAESVRAWMLRKGHRLNPRFKPLRFQNASANHRVEHE